VQTLRARLQRALLATTLLAQGTPMLCAGDELGHTQDGNNNPYCQDNKSTWINWSAADTDLQRFTEKLISLRQRLLPFANHWYSGVADAQGVHDIAWMNSDGTVLQGAAWNDPIQRTLVCLIGKPGRSGVPLLLLVNASHTPQQFKLPGAGWEPLLDSSHPLGLANRSADDPAHYPVPAHALVLLQAA
jgi:glycogen operon protein